MQSNYGPRSAKRLFNERRGITRDRSGQKAAFRLGRGPAAQCILRDLSDGGARLTVDNPAELPDRFEIKVGSDNRWRSVRIRWRTRTEIGVAFT